MPPALERFDHVHVYTADRAAAEDWYRRVLGFTRVAELAFWATGEGPLTLGDASGQIHLALFQRPREKCRSTIALAATAAQFLEWRAHLAQSLGRAVEPVDHQVAWSLYFADPDGNPFEITSYDYQALLPHFGR